MRGLAIALLCGAVLGGLVTQWLSDKDEVVMECINAGSAWSCSWIVHGVEVRND